jgi:hypothetical protein
VPLTLTGLTIRILDMRSGTVILTGFLFCMAIIFISANTIEQGDINAVSMYFVVFFFPCLLLAILNGLYLRALNKFAKGLKALLCLIPIVILTLIALIDNLTIRGIDGNLTFASMVGAIGLGLTNVLWMINVTNRKSA